MKKIWWTKLNIMGKAKHFLFLFFPLWLETENRCRTIVLREARRGVVVISGFENP